MGSFEPTDAQRARIKAGFKSVLESSIPSSEFNSMDLFSDPVARFIYLQVQRKLFEPKLANGGEKEEQIVRRLTRIAADGDRYVTRLCVMARIAAEGWKKVLPPEGTSGASGYYYECRPLSASGRTRTGDSMGPTDYDFLRTTRQKAVQEQNAEVKWLCDLLLAGEPRTVADFRMDPLYNLEEEDGQVSRLVILRNARGETRGPVSLRAEGFHSSQAFREWLLALGNFSWKGNQTEIDMLHEDIGAQLAHTTVRSIPRLGWHELSRKADKLDGVWFFGDCAYRNGVRLKADDDGIYWIEGIGYRLAERPLEGMKYGQGLPQLWHDCIGKPLDRLSDLKVDLRDPGEGERGQLRGLFMELCHRLKDVVGSYDGYITIGSMLAYAAAPELYAWRSQFPGLWLHGERGSGKTTILRDLMRVWGFNLDSGLELKQKAGNTATGMIILTDQYSNLPVWADEFRRGEVSDDKVDVIHAAFNRGAMHKWNPTGVQRQIRTAFVVSGESTTNDSGLRQRYPHIHITKRHREDLVRESGINHLEWFLKSRDAFRFIGRFLIENREELTDRLMAILKSYIQDQALSDDRIKFVSGVSYAAWTAMNDMLEGFDAQTMLDFRRHCQAHMKASMIEVESDSNINKFWSELVVAVQTDALSLENFRVELDPEGPCVSPTKPKQSGWRSYKLFFWPDPVLSDMAIFLRKRGDVLPLSRKDLRTQLSVQPYWIAGRHVKRIGTATPKLWAINVNLHPMGYQEVTDEEYEASKVKDENMNEALDPRKGELFVLINKVLSRQRG